MMGCEMVYLVVSYEHGYMNLWDVYGDPQAADKHASYVRSLFQYPVRVEVIKRMVK